MSSTGAHAALPAPFPWFGGKSRIADTVWDRFGDVPNFVDPFCGSLAILLRRPHWRLGEPWTRTETVNDINAWLTNFWRAVRHEPDAVAAAASDPVSELDLHARGNAIFYRDDWYQRRGHASVDAWVEWLRDDPDHYDTQIAGWWVWGQCASIGDNWNSGGHSARRDAQGMPCGICRSRPVTS